MSDERPPVESARRDELLEAIYAYAAGRGLAELSLRPMATEIGSSPRVLLYLFGSKDGLVRALLARARADELELLGEIRRTGEPPIGLDVAVDRTWSWLAAPEHRGLLCLWVEAYARSLTEPDGPWAGFATQSVADWLAVFARCQPPRTRRTKAALTARTTALALVRGALLDLLATGDVIRSGAAVHTWCESMRPALRGWKARTSGTT
jgi:AcrR family transcriptional regulator